MGPVLCLANGIFMHLQILNKIVVAITVNMSYELLNLEQFCYFIYVIDSIFII